ncbi:MAG: DUF6036 family nucleotidyltransferase [bacterium]|nr:nucleotidyl transferase AbiEii/AbiGii toxin family protein [bacterium]MBU1917251.1 nucleotidyl transferase AbiEii/AbiGii toxin family protein [bacterium]
MKDLAKSLKKISKILKKSKEKGDIKGYAMIGGMAVSARSRPRATKDIDFLISADPDSDFSKLFSFPKDYKIKKFKSDRFDPINGLVRVYDNDGNELIDLIPVFWDWQNEAIKHAEEIEFLETTIPIAKIEDLIVLKLKAGGPQDLLDIEELLKAAHHKKLNKKRLLELAKRARVDKKLSKFT